MNVFMVLIGLGGIWLVVSGVVELLALRKARLAGMAHKSGGVALNLLSMGVGLFLIARAVSAVGFTLFPTADGT